MASPLVSVVIPAYNAEATILETIASVRAQMDDSLPTQPETRTPIRRRRGAYARHVSSAI